MDTRYVEFHNGQKMPILGLGTWQAADRQELTKALNDALEAGYRHFDTAYNYTNEAIVGDVLKSWIDAGKVKREDLFITTKLPGTGLEETRVEHFLKLSLAALKLDYVDLYLIHLPVGLKYVDDVTLFPMEGDSVALDLTTDHLKVWKSMEAQVTAGRAKAIGLSNFNEAQIERIVGAAKIKPANLQVEANVYFQQKPLREACAKHGITFCAYAPFGSPGRTTLYEKLGIKGFVDPGLLNDPVVAGVAKAHGKTSGQVLLRFLTQQNIVVIPKSVQTKRVIENSQILDFTLTPAEMKELEGLDRGAEGRTFNFFAFKGIEKHPECPYK